MSTPYVRAKAALTKLNARGETERVLRILEKLAEMPAGTANYSAIFKQIDKQVSKLTPQEVEKAAEYASGKRNRGDFVG